MIEIKVEGSVVSVQTTEALYCGSQDVHTCKFIFDTSWESFSKSAVFRVNGKTITVLVDADNSCILPWELLVRGNIGQDIEVGLYGVSADAEVLTSVWDSLGTVREGSELGNDAREPSAGVYEQVMSNVRRVDEKVDNYNTEVQTQVQRAESAASSAVGSAESAAESEMVAKNSAAAAVNAKTAVESALNNLPAGGTLVINDLTTGGTTAALSAEMGKVLNNKKANQNLLHNWYCPNAINQRGLGEYSGEKAVTIDRWNAITPYITVTPFSSGGALKVHVTGDIAPNNQIFTQKLEGSLAGRMVTFSVLVSECSGAFRMFIGNTASTSGRLYSENFTEPGLYTLTGIMPDVAAQGAGFQKMGLGEYQMSIVAMKLEFGDTQTLANWDGTSFVLNEVPDYADELRKCQRYQLRIARKDGATYYVNIGSGVASSAGTSIRVTIPTPVTMRANPTIKYLNGANISSFVVRSPGGDIKPTAVNSIVYDNSVMLILTVSGVTANETYTVDFHPNGFLLDANL